VIRTRVGYSGGTKRNPTYHDLGDHSETVQIDFDPARVSYEQLLDFFWKAHDPTSRSWSRQYRAALFFHNEEQKRSAEESRDREAARIRGKIRTEILPAAEFYLAEGYHQKYYLRLNSFLSTDFRQIFPSEMDFVNSTAATRVNGYIGGYGTITALKEELDQLGLSEEGRKRLLASASGSRQ
jgi:peptide-methionine (S)-S-oxide reductase